MSCVRCLIQWAISSLFYTGRVPMFSTTRRFPVLQLEVKSTQMSGNISSSCCFTVHSSAGPSTPPQIAQLLKCKLASADIRDKHHIPGEISNQGILEIRNTSRRRNYSIRSLKNQLHTDPYNIKSQKMFII